MKLLFVSHWSKNLLIFREWMLAEAVRRGHEVLVLCPEDESVSRFGQIGVRYFPWHLRRLRHPRFLGKAFWDVYGILKRESPDRVVVYCLLPIAICLPAALFSGMIRRLVAVFTGMGSLWTLVERQSWRQRTLRLALQKYLSLWLRRVSAVVVLNRDDRELILGWFKGRFAPRIFLTRGEGVERFAFMPATARERAVTRSALGIPENALVIGYVGRLIRDKGIEDFIEIAKIVIGENPRAHVLIVGSPDPGNLTSLSAEQLSQVTALPRVHWVPWTDAIRAYYAAMDVLLYLSWREGRPVAPLEALSMGIPVVARDAVGTRELADAGIVLLREPDIRKRCIEVLTEISRQKPVVGLPEFYERACVQGEFLADLENDFSGRAWPKISVITVVKNGAAFLENCLKSVWRQGYPAVEHVVKDGGSTDETLAIIERWRSQIHFLGSGADGGIYPAMNACARAATGEILVFLNADDELADGALRAVAEEFMKGYAVVWGDCLRGKNPREALLYRSMNPGVSRRKIPWRMPASHPAVYITRDLFMRLGGYDERYRYAADYDLLAKVWLSGALIGQVNRVLAFFRAGGESARHWRAVTRERLMIARQNGMSPLKREMGYLISGLRTVLFKPFHESPRVFPDHLA